MSVSDWLNEVPDEWEPPSELLEPSGSVEANLAIKMLSCDYIGHDVRVLLGRFIAEHSLFTMWFLKEGKSSRHGPAEAMKLAGAPLAQTRLVYEAWRRFEDVSLIDGSDAVVGERRRAARQELAQTLRAAIAALSQARTGPPTD